MILHHVSLGTNDLKRAKAFYESLMAQLGLRMLKQSDRMIGYGLTEIIFSLEIPVDGKMATAGNGTHVAFHAGHRTIVEACHKCGLACGGQDEGGPALRDYDANYYAAFLRDPDGNKIEIVTFSAD